MSNRCFLLVNLLSVLSTLQQCFSIKQLIFGFFLTGLRYIRVQLSDDNVVENQEKKSSDEELSARNFFKTAKLTNMCWICTWHPITSSLTLLKGVVHV